MTRSDFDLMRALNAEVIAHGIANDEWFRITFAEQVPAGRWTTPAALLANDALGMDQLVADIVAGRPALEEATVWSGMHQRIGWPVVGLASAYLANVDRLIRIDPADVRLALSLVGQDPGVGGVCLTRARVAVLPDDPWARLESSFIDVVADASEQHRLLAADACSFLAPLVEVVRARVKVGRRGLWGMSLDSLLWPFAVERDDDEPSTAQARVAVVLAGFAGTPLARAVDWVGFEHGGRQYLRMRTTSCCLAYKWPAESEPRCDGRDPQWDHYCASCPLLPRKELILRATYALDHPEDHR